MLDHGCADGSHTSGAGWGITGPDSSAVANASADAHVDADTHADSHAHTDTHTHTGA